MNIKHGAAAIAASAIFVTGFSGVAEAKTSHIPTWRSGNYICKQHTKVMRGHKSRTVCHRIKRHKSSGSSVWVLPAYVVRCESGGNPRAVNYSNPNRPAGLYQIITSTWRGYGGGRYASTADRASVYHQGLIARKVLAGQGSHAWECWK